MQKLRIIALTVAIVAAILSIIVNFSVNIPNKRYRELMEHEKIRVTVGFDESIDSIKDRTLGEDKNKFDARTYQSVFYDLNGHKPLYLGQVVIVPGPSHAVH